MFVRRTKNKQGEKPILVYYHVSNTLQHIIFLKKSETNERAHHNNTYAHNK